MLIPRPSLFVRAAAYSMATRGVRGRVAATLGIMLFAGGVAWADDQNRPAGVDPALIRSDRSDVYLNDSLEAADAIASARRLANSGRWGEAAALLQKTADAFGDRLVRVSDRHYRGLREHVALMISTWPTEGVRAYRDLCEPRIREALDPQTRSRTVDDLLPLLDRYFCTATAAELADMIGQLAIEAGDLALARRVYRRILELHPDRAQHAAHCTTMLALVGALAGGAANDDEVDDGAQIRWMGESRKVSDVLRTIRDTFHARTAPPSPDEWPMFAGNPTRQKAASCDVDQIGLLWRFHAAAPRLPDDDEAFGGPLFGHEGRVARLSIQPVVSGDLVFIQWSREVIALQRSTGVEQWHFKADVSGVAELDEFDEFTPQWDSVTVHDGRVYVAFAGNAPPYYAYESSGTGTELICLDARTGREVWRANRDNVGEAFAELHFDSSPIIADGRLHLVGRRRRSFGFEDCYLYRFRTIDGTYESRTHLGSASTGSFGSRQATLSIPAMVDDTIFVCTNLGSIAAVSAHTGDVRWLRLYARDRVSDDNISGWFSNEVHSWEMNPVIGYGDRLLCLPTDADHLLVLDQRDGRLVQSVPVSAMGSLRSILGVRGDRLCGVGDGAICIDLPTKTELWSSPLPADGEAVGRGVWVDDRLIVPTKAGLSIFDVATGNRSDLTWDEEGSAGNLLGLSDQLLVAGAGTLSAYVRKSDIWTALWARMAESPDDPLPALELAEVAFGGGEIEAAMAAFDEAIRRADASPTPPEMLVSTRIFRDAIRFAERLSARSDEPPAWLDPLFQRAARFGTDPSHHVEYRLTFGRLFERFERVDDALRLYQQILRDRSLRELPADESHAGGLSAADESHARIDQLIERFGRGVYASFEQEAARRLDDAKAARDEALLTRIVETYPNSHAATAALVEKGRVQAAAGQFEHAARTYASAYHRIPAVADHPDLMRRIADAYERAGLQEHAYRWLTKATREHPNALIKHNGRTITFEAYRERLAHVRKLVEPSRPNPVLPLTRRTTLTLEDGCQLLTPRFSAAPAGDWSRYYVWTAEGVRSFDAHTADERWSAPSRARLRPELLLATRDVALLANLYEVFAVSAATGERVWTQGAYPAHLDDGGADWESGDTLRAHAVGRDHVFTVRDDGLISCVRITDGQVIWSATHRPATSGSLKATDDWLAFLGAEHGQPKLHLLDAGTGQLIDTIPIVESRPVEDIFITLDGQLGVVTSQSIATYDPQTRQRRWRIDLDGHVRQSSVLIDVDALYYSDDGRLIKKIGLQDGRFLWTTEWLTSRGQDGLTNELQDGSLVVSTTTSVSAVDAVNGLTLWQGVTGARPNFQRRIITRSYVFALDIPEEEPDADCVAYFYDHRNASGVIPRVGGRIELGRLFDVREVLVTDGGLMIQNGTTIHGWISD